MFIGIASRVWIPKEKILMIERLDPPVKHKGKDHHTRIWLSGEMSLTMDSTVEEAFRALGIEMPEEGKK